MEFDLETFAAQRDGELTSMAELIRPELQVALTLSEPERSEAILNLASAAYTLAFGEMDTTLPPSPGREAFITDITEAVERLEPDGTQAQEDRMATWLATAAYGAAAFHSARRFQSKTWVTMRDADVRDTHDALEGVTVGSQDTFTVATTPPAIMQYPGQPVGPVEAWINCRCVLHIGNAITAAVELDTEGDPIADDDMLLGDEPPPAADMEAAVPEPLEWHGVIAPVGVRSGDGRTFGELTWRDLPLPLEWQETTGEGHDGSHIVGVQDRMAQVGNEVRAAGRFIDGPVTDTVVGQLSEGALRSCSVQIDDVIAALDEDEMGETFDGRICATTLVNVGAFPECWIAIGAPPAGFLDPAVEDPGTAEDVVAAGEFRSYDKAQRDAMAKRGTAMPDGSFPIADVEDLRNAIQAIGRAKDPDAAKRHIRKRAKALGAENLIPDTWAALTAGRGPGWITDPVPTKFIHDYWTRPDQPGWKKIRWGTPGDFTRMARKLRKYVEPIYVNRTAAQWHFDALGYWPGDLGKPGNPPDTPENRQRAARHADKHSLEDTVTIPNHSHTMTNPLGNHTHGFTVVAAAPPQRVIPRDWFDDPQLDGPTPLTVLPDGRVFGHIATFGTCHIGIQGECIEAPKSKTDYAYMHTGTIDTDQGEIPVGVLTMDTGHADMKASHQATVAHYDHTGTQAASCRFGEDEHGVWCAGVMHLMDEGDFQRFKLAAASGDWRNIGGNLELVAALMVNTPGFPIPRPALAASAGRMTALVAARVVEHTGEFDATAIADAVMAKLDARDKRRNRLVQLQPLVASAQEAHDEQRKARAEAILASVGGA